MDKDARTHKSQPKSCIITNFGVLVIRSGHTQMRGACIQDASASAIGAHLKPQKLWKFWRLDRAMERLETQNSQDTLHRWCEWHGSLPASNPGPRGVPFSSLESVLYYFGIPMKERWAGHDTFRFLTRPAPTLHRTTSAHVCRGDISSMATWDQEIGSNKPCKCLRRIQLFINTFQLVKLQGPWRTTTKDSAKMQHFFVSFHAALVRIKVPNCPNIAVIHCWIPLNEARRGSKPPKETSLSSPNSPSHKKTPKRGCASTFDIRSEDLDPMTNPKSSTWKQK